MPDKDKQTSGRLKRSQQFFHSIFTSGCDRFAIFIYIKKIFCNIKNLLLFLFTGITIAALIITLSPETKNNNISKCQEQKLNNSLTTWYYNLSSDTTKHYLFEEQRGQNFDFKVRQADLALLRTTTEFPDSVIKLEHKNITTRYFYGNPFHFQTILIHLPAKYTAFFQKLQKNLKQIVVNSDLIINDYNTWSIVINGQTTHLLIIKPETADNATNAPDTTTTISPAQKKAHLAIIIDDMGESLLFARNLIRLDFPVTFSVLPYNTRTRKICSLAKDFHIELMLHLPMEPEGYPDRADPGPGALFVHMAPLKIKTIFINDLHQVPGAVGINNHMGSRFTRNKKSMDILFKEIKKRGLFFVDSLTTHESVARILARKNNVPYLQRQIFLDNIQEKKAILFQLQKAENIALKKGIALAIGHPYSQTLKALQDWQKIRNKSVQVVQVRRLLQIKNSKF